jgi:hypothetical protein
MKNDKFLPYMVIIGIVAIVAIVTLFLGNGRIEGALGYSYVEEEQAICSDDDPTNDFYTAGIVKHGKVQYYDYCLNDRLLYQYYCPISSTVRLLAPYECPNGCLNGACIAE